MRAFVSKGRAAIRNIHQHFDALSRATVRSRSETLREAFGTKLHRILIVSHASWFHDPQTRPLETSRSSQESSKMLRESFPKPPGTRSGHPWEPFGAPKEPQPRNSQPLCSETHTFAGTLIHTPAHPPPSPLLHYN